MSNECSGQLGHTTQVGSVEARVEKQVDYKADMENGRLLNALVEQLGSERVELNAPLAPYTTFRIGGPADMMYDATSASELASAVTAARSLNIPWFVLGLGANVLIGDRGFRGLVIRNRARGFELLPEGRPDQAADQATNHTSGGLGSGSPSGVVDSAASGTSRSHSGCKLVAESGAVMQDLVLETVRLGYSGLEHFIGIPSTVGGALWQNLHFLSPAPERARTVFISEVFSSCEILSENGERKTVGPDYVRFGYDDSIFHHRRDVVLKATFNLARADPESLHRVLQENLSWRGSRHPWLSVHPSAGSIFRKIEGVGAGRLIDQCGLKGFRIGDAQISYIHANIIVNLGHATAADVRALIAHAQQAVNQRFGYLLKPEIGMVGEF